MANTGAQFWDQFLNLMGDTTSIRSYYLPQSGEGIDGKFAQEGEYGNVIDTLFQQTEPNSAERQQAVDMLDAAGFWAEGDELAYWVNFDGNPEDLVSLKSAAEERLPKLFGADDALVEGTPDAGTTDDVIAPTGETDVLPGIMGGGILRTVQNPSGQRDFYVMEYEYPPDSGNSFYYRFSDLDTLKAMVGDQLPGIEIGDAVAESALQDWVDGGNINEVMGVEGTFAGYMNDIIRDISAKSGITDPTRLGQALANPEIQLIMAKAAEGLWTDAQVKAEMRNSTYYKDVLYPGIENFYGQTDNPEGAYKLYEQNVTSGLESLNVARDADGSYDSTIRDMLDSGIDDAEFVAFTPTYLRAAGNDNYRASLNQWLGAAGQAPLSDFNSFFDVLAGTAPAEVTEIVELAGISFIAGEQGFDPGQNLIREIASRTDLSESQIAQSFLQSDRDLLALGPSGLRSSGITQEDIISARAGFTTGQRSLAEMENLIRKVKIEQGIKDDPTAKFFTDYNQEGAPIKAGLRSSIAEGA